MHSTHPNDRAHRKGLHWIERDPVVRRFVSGNLTADMRGALGPNLLA